MYQEIIVVGRTTKDANLETFTAGGNQVSKVSGSIAYRSKKKDREGKQENRFMDFSIIGKPAEIFAQYVGKGSIVLLRGEFIENRWQDATTQQPRSRWALEVDNFRFIETKEPNGQGAVQQQEATQRPSFSQQQPQGAFAGFGGQNTSPFGNAAAGFTDDDLPF